MKQSNSAYAHKYNMRTITLKSLMSIKSIFPHTNILIKDGGSNSFGTCCEASNFICYTTARKASDFIAKSAENK